MRVRWIASLALFFLLACFFFLRNSDFLMRKILNQSLTVDLRSRATLQGISDVKILRQTWQSRQTAILVVDMWDQHWHRCSINDRIEKLAPAINRFLAAARKKNILVIHAPSDVAWYYDNHPGRKRVQKFPQANLGNIAMSRENYLLPTERQHKADPVDQHNISCALGCVPGQVWTRQNKAIEIEAHDLISDLGNEIWNALEFYGIKNVIMTGVHANGCILSRSFGARNLALSGKQVVVCRDLVDILFFDSEDSQAYHDAFHEVIGYIEKYVCPTMISSDITQERPFVLVPPADF